MSQPDPLSGEPLTVGLAEKYGNAVQAFFRRRLRDDDLARDLTQDVFAALLRQKSLDSVDNLDGYIFTVASNLLKDYKRKMRRGQAAITEIGFQQVESPSYAIDPERIVAGRQDYARAITALQRLTERQRTIFILNRFERMSGREIAQRLGISISLVEKEMIFSVRHLRERLS